MLLVSGDFHLIVWARRAVSLLMQTLFVFWMLTMTCHSSLLIRVLNELFLPVCTPEFDFQLPRQLQLIWLHARETALPYFSGSIAQFNTRYIVLTILVSLIHFLPLYSPYLLWSLVICSIFSMQGKNVGKKSNTSITNDFTKAQRRHREHECFYLCKRCYEFVLQHHGVLKCHIQRLRSWYAEKRAQQRHSGLDVCQKADAINHKKRSCFCLITKKGLRAVFVPVAVVCSWMSFSTQLSSASPQCKFLHCSPKCCWCSWCMGNQWCCTESIWVYLGAMIHISSPPLSSAPLL